MLISIFDIIVRHMKKTTTISLAIIGLIVIALVFVLAAQKANAPAADRSGEESTQVPSNSQTTSQNGQYVEYDEAKLANSKDANYLFFHAPWCSQCRAVEASIHAGGKIPEGVIIYKLDYDSNQELRKKYGVTLQTTFVKVDSQGNFIDKYVAYDSPSIDSVVENFIDK